MPCGTPFTVLVTSVFDNKNGKDFFPGGPDGSDSYDDLLTLAEEKKVEVLGDDPSFYWEADYEDVSGSTVSGVEALLQLRRESDATGTFRIEVRVGGSVETTQDVNMTTLVDDDAGGPPAQIIVSVPLDGAPVSALNSLQVRVFIVSGNGKKVFWSYTELRGAGP